LSGISLLFSRFYIKSKRQARELDRFVLKIIKKVPERHDILGLGTDQRITKFWDVGKRSPHLVSREAQRRLEKGPMFKFPIRKIRKSLGLFISREKIDLIKERRKISNKAGRAMEQIHRDVFYLLKKIFKRKSHYDIIQDFEKTLVKTGKFTRRHLKTLRDIVNAQLEFKKTKSNLYHDIDNIRREAEVLINDLVHYLQKLDIKEKKKIKSEVQQYLKGPARIKHIYRRAFRNFKGYITVSTNAIKKLFTKKLETEESDFIKSQKKQEIYHPQIPELKYDEKNHRRINQ